MAEIPVEEYVCTWIRRAEQALIARHEAVLRGYGLTIAGYGVLLTLAREGGLSGAQLARAAGVTQQTMASVLAGLQTKGLVAREVSPVHAKVLIASLTDKGSRLQAEASEQVMRLEKELADAFSADEMDQLCGLLERATAVLVRQSQQ